MHSTRKAKMKANPKEQIDELDEDWPEDLGDFHD
jgi:hypothetical protein